MSVRFSLRFEGRSICRLLGVAMCDKPDCENVVAIIVVIYLHHGGCSQGSFNITYSRA
jgi:hypothetical protein